MTENPSIEHPVSEPKHSQGKAWILSGLVIFLVLLADQWLKIWVKTTMTFNSEFPVFGNWFFIHFTENNGMAFGIELGGEYGKLLLTSFRILAVGFGVWVLRQQIQKKAHTAFIVCIALILAGAIGNIIDSVFYGKLFTDINNYSGGWFHGRVVDMLYFPLVEGYYPEWVPFKGGDYFIFFSPVFNIADAAISCGVFAILLFQKKFFPMVETQEKEEIEILETAENQSVVTEESNTEEETGKA